MRKYKTWLTFMLSFFMGLVTVNIVAPQLSYFNIKIRNFLIHGEFHKFTFTEKGIPEQLNPRIGRYTSPFYVVHFGLLYSEACRDLVDSSKHHWLEDATLKYWYGNSPAPSLQNFKAALDWLLTNADDETTYGVTHFLYNFDWPYSGYPSGVIKAPWWSGLTDGYAIIPLLRGYDCFKNNKYLLLAEKLYNSVLTPISEGGSLTYWDGLPWIEEYVDPRASGKESPRVFNGMAYAYFGVLAFETYKQAQDAAQNASSALLASIAEHIYDFDMGYWSYYDAIGNPANIKYHGINWALTADPRISLAISSELRQRWAVGVRYPILYLIYGARTTAYFHLWFEVLLLTAVYFFIIEGAIRYASR